jgi:hypothetical protein
VLPVEAQAWFGGEGESKVYACEEVNLLVPNDLSVLKLDR